MVATFKLLKLPTGKHIILNGNQGVVHMIYSPKQQGIFNYYTGKPPM